MDETNLLSLMLGIIAIAIGIFWTVRNVLIVKKNRVIIGEIYDRRSGYKEHYFPVIKYTINNSTYDYTSTHYSILQRIGRKIRLVYNEKEKKIIGTLGELLFKPILILLCGLFISSVILFYELSK